MVVEELDDIFSISYKVMQDLKRVSIGIGCLLDATLLGLRGSKYLVYKQVHTVRTAPLEVHRWALLSRTFHAFLLALVLSVTAPANIVLSWR